MHLQSNEREKVQNLLDLLKKACDGVFCLIRYDAGLPKDYEDDCGSNANQRPMSLEPVEHTPDRDILYNIAVKPVGPSVCRETTKSLCNLFPGVQINFLLSDIGKKLSVNFRRKGCMKRNSHAFIPGRTEYFFLSRRSSLMPLKS